jgi:nitrite reductase/ring-hydroxylating ferredoxin subunit
MAPAVGFVGDATVVCPPHDRVFDLRGGAGVGRDNCVRAKPASVLDGVMIVDME